MSTFRNGNQHLVKTVFLEFKVPVDCGTQINRNPFMQGYQHVQNRSLLKKAPSRQLKLSKKKLFLDSHRISWFETISCPNKIKIIGLMQNFLSFSIFALKTRNLMWKPLKKWFEVLSVIGATFRQTNTVLISKTQRSDIPFTFVTTK